jgi:hypothetical protein
MDSQLIRAISRHVLNGLSTTLNEGSVLAQMLLQLNSHNREHHFDSRTNYHWREGPVHHLHRIDCTTKRDICLAGQESRSSITTVVSMSQDLVLHNPAQWVLPDFIPEPSTCTRDTDHELRAPPLVVLSLDLSSTMQSQCINFGSKEDNDKALRLCTI